MNNLGLWRVSLALLFTLGCSVQTAAPIDEGDDGEDAGRKDAGRRDAGGNTEEDSGGPQDSGRPDAGDMDGGGDDGAGDGGDDGGDAGPCNGANLQTDPNNCGECGKACIPKNVPGGDQGAYPTISECIAGHCAVSAYKGCRDGRGDCDNDYENGCEAWTGSDKRNCGVCALACEIPNASADCTFSKCVLIDCAAGFMDCNHDLADGCEAHFSEDEKNCGACGKACVFPHGSGECQNGKCVRTGCDSDWYDADKIAEDGCEYYCKPKKPQPAEVCADREDNNCDGQIDEGCPQEDCTAGQTIDCGSDEGECAHGRFECVGGKWDFSTCRGMTGPKAEECNNRDDDCNGAADDNLVKACSGADSGWCETGCGTGWWECKGGQWTKVPPAQGTAETCNGLDDDCNGKADDGSVPCPAGMAGVGVCFCIDRFEAARPDATDTWEGTANGPPVSKSGVLPWRDVSWAQADAACKAAGKRLCTADEWKKACEGIAATNYPYGDTYNPTACHGADSVPLNPKLAVAGSYPQCKSDHGVYDASGNVEEWNGTSFPDGKRGLRGGSYNTGDTPYLRCDYDAPPSDPSFHSPQIGFRCCKSP
ncbi:MAG: SUMF1/EgtB/PvdO family nonheme iron enzyme [Deltaproteobacteria bacterium]|nr:SUMF1/EgtB/PvdO family nonheme iron enzyme [Deltaproteobacteria bacterium]